MSWLHDWIGEMHPSRNNESSSTSRSISIVVSIFECLANFVLCFTGDPTCCHPKTTLAVENTSISYILGVLGCRSLCALARDVFLNFQNDETKWLNQWWNKFMLHCIFPTMLNVIIYWIPLFQLFYPRWLPQYIIPDPMKRWAFQPSLPPPFFPLLFSSWSCVTVMVPLSSSPLCPTQTSTLSLFSTY